MKILLGKQIKEADEYAINHEPISSLDLMERASTALSAELINHVELGSHLLFLIGKGNNGGDGLAIARMLSARGYSCSVCCLFEREALSEECRANLNRLPVNVEVVDLGSLFSDAVITNDTVLIDALLGSGVRGRTSEPIASVIVAINQLSNKKIAIDIPSGMNTEWQENSLIPKVDVTLTIEYPKLGMLLPDVGDYCGKIIVVPIGLSNEFMTRAETPFFYCDKEYIRTLLKDRSRFSYKNNFGHTLLICGSKNMSGAATLAVGGALRSGCGLVTAHLPYDERFGIMSNFPSVMFSFDRKEYFSELPSELSKYSSIGIGCGLGQSAETVNALKKLLVEVSCPLIIDADALNIIANYKLHRFIPKGSILTPHLGELKRLVGKWGDEKEKIEKVRTLAFEGQSVIVVKGANTLICNPLGYCFFNSTGNAGMAKAGSGDVLTGLMAGLVARGYPVWEAALVGVYLHGLAGDIASLNIGIEAMNSSDIIDGISSAFSSFK